MYIIECFWKIHMNIHPIAPIASILHEVGGNKIRILIFLIKSRNNLCHFIIMKIAIEFNSKKTWENEVRLWIVKLDIIDNRKV